MKWYLIILVWFFLLIGCKKESSNPVEPTPTTPVVKILSPTNNFNIIDSVTIDISATDDKGIVKVEILIDNLVAKTFSVPPFMYLWDASIITDSSQHSIYAKAYDGDNNISSSSVITVTINRLAPSDLTLVELTDKQVSLKWNDNSKIETSFVVEMSTDSISYSSLGELPPNTIETVISHSFTFGNKYYFKVGAKVNNSIKYSNHVSQKLKNVFMKTFGGVNDDGANCVQQTSDGGFVLAGSTRSFGAGQSDVYLIKTDSTGNKVWEKTFGGSNDDFGYSVQETFDGGYVITGSTSSFGAGLDDIYLVKTDANGNAIWEKTFGGSNWDYGRSVKQSTDGGFIITGWTYSLGAGEADVYLVKTDNVGNKIWEKTFGGSKHEIGFFVQQTSDGGFIIGGTKTNESTSDFYLIKTSTTGNKVWEKTFGGSNLEGVYSGQQTSDDGFIIVGYTKSFGVGNNDVYLVRTDISGNSIWEKTFGGSKDDMGRSVQQTSDGGFIVAGSTFSFGAGLDGIYLIKTDATGNKTWEKTFGDNGVGTSIQQTTEGGFIIAGSTKGDVVLIKTDSEGNAK